jgi:transposase-like protein
LISYNYKSKMALEQEVNPLSEFMYSLKAPETRRQWPHDTLIPLIKLHTKKGSLYYTDDHTAYASLDLIGKHQIIAHRMGEYVREDNSHINGIEGFCSYARTWLYHY